MKCKKVLVVHKLGYTTKEKKTLLAVKDFLHKNKILHRIISPLEVHHGMVHNRDLIIIIGGDGTFLKTAQYVEDKTPFLCINANIEKTEGFFSKTSIKNAIKKLQRIIKTKPTYHCLTRLQARIGRKTIEPCVNEYYVGKKRPYDVSNYVLQVKNKKEHQKSSGVLASTPAGSTAWTSGAGGRRLPLKSKKWQFVVREPYKGKLVQTKLQKALLGKKDKLIITPKSPMILVADALGREHVVHKGQKVIITTAEKPIYLIL